MSDLWVSPYVLESASRLNAVSKRRQFSGALIRKGAGYACIHPWPELGDPSLEECLACLRLKQVLPIVKRALACAAVDGLARSEGRSLFKNVDVPPSHATLPEMSNLRLDETVAAGFDIVKLKSPDLELLRQLLVRFSTLRFRIDLNETGRAEELVASFSRWSEEEKARVDFLEDPISFQPDHWKELKGSLGIPLANDRQVAADLGSDVLILKPAVDDLSMFMNRSARIVVTSYMDHPLGQTFAAFEAARFRISECCGLQTHGLFEKDAFTEALGPVAPSFSPPPGTGLGFDSLLEKLPWKKL